MKDNWEYVDFGEICDFVRGPFGGSLKKSYFKPKGIAVYEQRHAIYDDFSEVRYFVDEKKFDEMKRFELLSGDLIMSCSGTMGKVAIVPDGIKKGIINQALLKLTPKPVVDPRFLKLWMSSPNFQGEIERLSEGAAIKNVASVKILKLIKIPLPPLPEQKRIVAILYKAFEGIDTAIANTEKNLANARELFDSYLENVSSKKERLGDLVGIKTGKLNSNAAVEGGKYPFFTCSREVFAIDDYAFDCEAILLAGNNASGDFNVKHYFGKFNAYQRTYVITINDTSKLYYRFLYFQLVKALKELKKNSVGAATKFLKIGMIQNLLICVPPPEEQRIILDKLDSIHSSSENLLSIYNQKLTALSELKQSILSKAFSGELTTIKDDELRTEEVA